MASETELMTVERHFRAQGSRWTNQRALIVRTAFDTHDHFTADELLDQCRTSDPKVSRATVYRTLAVLEQAGFVEGLDTGDGGRRFEHVLGHDHHDHMVCQVCGVILEFRDEELEKRQLVAARKMGFTIDSHSLRLYGRCRKCAKRTGKARGSD
ncbi:MAG: transcriptional repressor [Planctomycetota bacterium]|nr:transcriptional repressor [Planctomycetota bacterium]